ncbi:M24 family metallopeptidase, partial [Bacillus pumilus]|uniref:M24 family metallopeptidase n=1 Tax=Bacillus pumilus TaxID=1408 RepID=UPI0034D97FC6
MTTTIALPTPTHNLNQIYHILLQPQNAPLHTINPPLTPKQPHPITPHIIQNYPYRQYFRHSTPHRLRIQLHQAP